MAYQRIILHVIIMFCQLIINYHSITYNIAWLNVFLITFLYVELLKEKNAVLEAYIIFIYFNTYYN